MIPRPWLFQAILSGVLLFFGYGLGVAIAKLWIYLELPSPSIALRHLVFWPVAALTTGQFVYFYWYSSDWQNMGRALMELPPVEEPYYLRVLLVAMSIFLLLLGLSFLFARILLWVVALSKRFLNRRFASVLTVSGFLFLFVSAVDGWLVSRIISTVDDIHAATDTENPPNAVQPTEPERSGSAASLVAWDDLGFSGKRFVHEGPRAADIAAFAGQASKEPIRVYVSLRAADGFEALAQRALDELQRTDAFSRSVLVIATPTGTGWLQNEGLAPLEIMHRGDTAIVGVQYSYLASPLSLLLEPRRAQIAAKAVFEVIHGYWKSLPPNARPKLYLFGLSLGSLGSEASASFSALISDPYHGAVWAGPTFRNPIWRRVVAQRTHDSPAWAPEFEDGSLIRVHTRYTKSPPGRTNWGPVRVIYVVNPSDAIAYFRETMWFKVPDWFAEPRGPDISPLFAWTPLVTFLQVAADMQFAAQAPEGYGHNYGMRDYARAWATVTGREGWAEEDTLRLEQFFTKD